MCSSLLYHTAREAGLNEKLKDIKLFKQVKHAVFINPNSRWFYYFIWEKWSGKQTLLDWPSLLSMIFNEVYAKFRSYPTRNTPHLYHYGYTVHET